jgi:Acyclic terpene utilisation family protein AtuA
VTGGYFADPGVKDVPDLHRLGFPLAEITPDGDVVVTKVSGSGGVVTTATCTEQLLYEVHDPAAYVTPDVVADFSRVTMEADGVNRVRVSGADGRPRPEMLKVSVGHSVAGSPGGSASAAPATSMRVGRSNSRASLQPRIWK